MKELFKSLKFVTYMRNGAKYSKLNQEKFWETAINKKEVIWSASADHVIFIFNGLRI